MVSHSNRTPRQLFWQFYTCAQRVVIIFVPIVLSYSSSSPSSSQLYFHMCAYVGPCMCMHVHVCVCVYMHMHMSMCMHMHVCVCVCVHTHAHVSTCICKQSYFCVFMIQWPCHQKAAFHSTIPHPLAHTIFPPPLMPHSLGLEGTMQMPSVTSYSFSKLSPVQGLRDNCWPL